MGVLRNAAHNPVWLMSVLRNAAHNPVWLMSVLRNASHDAGWLRRHAAATRITVWLMSVLRNASHDAGWLRGTQQQHASPACLLSVPSAHSSYRIHDHPLQSLMRCKECTYALPCSLCARPASAGPSDAKNASRPFNHSEPPTGL